MNYLHDFIQSDSDEYLSQISTDVSTSSQISSKSPKTYIMDQKDFKRHILEGLLTNAILKHQEMLELDVHNEWKMVHANG
jgi:hypothetical protein